MADAQGAGALCRLVTTGVMSMAGACGGDDVVRTDADALGAATCDSMEAA